LRKLFFLLPILSVLLFSCGKPDAVSPAANDPDYARAKAFLYRQNDSAFFYFNKVAAAAKDSLQTAYAYNYMARIQSEAGDHFGSQESLSFALKFLNPGKEKDRQCLSSTYNELGLTSINLKDYDAAISFFGQSLKYSTSKKFQLSLSNNLALAYQKKGDYPQALKIYGEIIGQVTRKQTYARVLSNIARTRWLAQPAYRAAPEFLRALAIRRQEKDVWGQNASYAHLADYYSISRPDSALFYASQMYAVARELNSPDDQLEALEKLIRVGPLQEAKRYFANYRRLNDSLQTARNVAKNQFAFIRYEVEKSRAENLTLQKDISEKRYQLLKQRLLLYLALVVLLVAIFWYRKRKKRLETEKQEAIRESQLRTSKKVHDVVANGLYRIMTELDHQSELDRTRLADKIEDLYEKSRDISYEQEPFSSAAFHDKVTELVTSFANDQLKIALVGNNKEVWEGVSPPAQYDIEHVLQELMVNMKKHSQATSVAIRFERQAEQIQIHYTDNGVGIPGEVAYKNGLTNTGNRINSLHGTITFDTNVQQGLKIHLTFPVA
jgi:tetratricopeptide (TPR) repeat protein